jgi:hypothetical protein
MVTSWQQLATVSCRRSTGEKGGQPWVARLESSRPVSRLLAFAWVTVQSLSLAFRIGDDGGAWVAVGIDACVFMWLYLMSRTRRDGRPAGYRGRHISK